MYHFLFGWKRPKKDSLDFYVVSIAHNVYILEWRDVCVRNVCTPHSYGFLLCSSCVLDAYVFGCIWTFYRSPFSHLFHFERPARPFLLSLVIHLRKWPFLWNSWKWLTQIYIRFNIVFHFLVYQIPKLSNYRLQRKFKSENALNLNNLLFCTHFAQVIFYSK